MTILSADRCHLQANANWFSGHNAVKVYSLFLELDKDQNGQWSTSCSATIALRLFCAGMLSTEELKAFTGFAGTEQIQFTQTALDRLFSEYISYQPLEMDYKAFVSLVLACENMTAPESLRYFFRVVDYDHSGRLSAEKIKFFYKDVRECLLATGYDAPSPDHVALEIFDLVACNDARGPSLAELTACKQGHTALTMLLDVNGFWKYDNRETLMAQNNHDEEEEEAPALQQQAPPKVVQRPFVLREESYDDEGFESFDD